MPEGFPVQMATFSAGLPKSSQTAQPAGGPGAGKDAKAGELIDDEPVSDGEENSGDEKIFIGIIAESKDLYAKYDKDQNRSWSHSPPDGLETAAENEKTLKYAILVRKMKPKKADSLKPLVIDSIVIQSPYLKEVLGKVFDGYTGIVTDVSRLIFSAPFEPFVHRWEAFLKAKNNPDNDEDTKTHLNLLYNVMHAELKELIQQRNDYIRNQAVTWEHIWTLFPPKSIALASIRDKPVAVRFERGEYKETKCDGMVYQLTCQSVDWDGRKMGWSTTRRKIPSYAGTMPFSELACCPLEYTPDAAGIRDMLIARGRTFQALAGSHYKYYNGTAAYHPRSDPRQTHVESVTGRIVTDGVSWDRSNPENALFLRPLHQAYDHAVAETQDGEDIRIRMMMRAFRGRYPGYSQQDDENDLRSANNEPRPDLSEEQLLLASPIVRGYSLRSKKWMEFFVDNVSDVRFDSNAFDSLVLDQEHKRLILAFAQSQVKNKSAFDDVISGKGRGIIIMLSGGPGIGKTLTAESVAEEMHAPLYIMSASDLGENSYDVEYKLNEVLNIVAKWNAVLLLDECDIFLEERTPQNMDRNTIVGIFLRMLEYYQGILFMTTNRVKSIDPAFHSRIHLSLNYPDLDTEARVTIWKTFLRKITSTAQKEQDQKRHEITEDEILRLGQLNMNGRQIKNALKMASLLPLQVDEPLKFDHIHSVLKIQGYSL